jgi:hypothetical protein
MILRPLRTACRDSVATDGAARRLRVIPHLTGGSTTPTRTKAVRVVDPGYAARLTSFRRCAASLIDYSSRLFHAEFLFRLRHSL